MPLPNSQAATSLPYTDRIINNAPDLLFDFDGHVDAADLSSVFSYWGLKGSSYGTQADTSIARTGKTSSALTTIEQGSDGLRQDATNGTFGGGFNADSEWQLGEGDEIYAGLWLRIPAGFSWETNTISTKFMRHTYSGKTSKLEFQIYSNGGDRQVGWRVIHESTPQFTTNDARLCSVIIPEDTWVFLTFYTKFSSVGADSITRISVGDQFAYERNGTSLTFRNSEGDIQTDTVESLPTLEDAGTVFDGSMLFTYWNGGNTTNTGTHPIQDQGLNIGSFGYRLNTPTLVDDQGNPVLDGSDF